MNTFQSTVIIANTIAEYEISVSGNSCQARLKQQPAATMLPLTLNFWKQEGQWRTTHYLQAHALYQFNYLIENHLLSASINKLKMAAA